MATGTPELSEFRQVSYHVELNMVCYCVKVLHAVARGSIVASVAHCDSGLKPAATIEYQAVQKATGLQHSRATCK